MASDIVSFIVETVNGDLAAMEEQFTTSTVQRLIAAYPTKNAIIYHDQGSGYSFVGATHAHYELNVPLGTKGYEIFVFDYGT